jgi:hypothetical protein
LQTFAIIIVYFRHNVGKNAVVGGSGSVKKRILVKKSREIFFLELNSLYLCFVFQTFETYVSQNVNVFIRKHQKSNEFFKDFKNKILKKVGTILRQAQQPCVHCP